MSLAHSHTGWSQQTGLQASVGPKPHVYGTSSAPTYRSLHLRSQKMARKAHKHIRTPEVLAVVGASLTLSVSRGREAVLLGPMGTLVITTLLEPSVRGTQQRL